MKLKLKFPFSNAFLVLELNDLLTKSKETNLMMTAMVSDLGRAPTFKGGLGENFYLLPLEGAGESSNIFIWWNSSELFHYNQSG